MNKTHSRSKAKFAFLIVLLFAVVWLMFSIGASAKAENPFEGAVKINPGTYKGQFSKSNLADGYIVRAKAGQELCIKVKFTIVPGTMKKSDMVIGCDMAFYNSEFKNILPKCDYKCYADISTNEPDIVTIHWLSSVDEEYYLILKQEPDDEKYGYAKYTLDVSLIERYDANSDKDAGGHKNTALKISPGTYKGHLAKTIIESGVQGSNPHGNDLSDFYKIHLAKGQQLDVRATPEERGAVGLIFFGEEGDKEIRRVFPSEKGVPVKISWKAPSDHDIYIDVTTMHRDRDPNLYIGKYARYEPYFGGSYTLKVDVTPKISSLANTSNEAKSPSKALKGARYFPLSVGTKWVYDVIEETGDNIEKTGEALLEIISEEVGVYEARLTKKNIVGEIVFQDTMELSFKKGDKGGLYKGNNLVVPDMENKENLSNCGVQDQIFFNISSFEAGLPVKAVTMIRHFECEDNLYTVDVPVGSFENCIKTQYTLLGGDAIFYRDYDNAEYFAPNVGLVKHRWKRGKSEAGFFELTDYKLNAPP